MAKRTKIVIIEDDPVTFRLLAIVLNGQGFQVHVASEAETGLHLISTENPDLIILDIFLPGRDGLSLLEEIRQRPATKNTPVLMLTSEEKSKGEVRAMELGANGYLTKPVNPVVLQEKIAALIH